MAYITVLLILALAITCHGQPSLLFPPLGGGPYPHEGPPSIGIGHGSAWAYSGGGAGLQGQRFPALSVHYAAASGAGGPTFASSSTSGRSYSSPFGSGDEYSSRVRVHGPDGAGIERAVQSRTGHGAEWPPAGSTIPQRLSPSGWNQDEWYGRPGVSELGRSTNSRNQWPHAFQAPGDGSFVMSRSSSSSSSSSNGVRSSVTNTVQGPDGRVVTVERTVSGNPGAGASISSSVTTDDNEFQSDGQGQRSYGGPFAASASGSASAGSYPQSPVSPTIRPPPVVPRTPNLQTTRRSQQPLPQSSGNNDPRRPYVRPEVVEPTRAPQWAPPPPPLSCMGSDNQPLDWFIVYRLPRSSTTSTRSNEMDSLLYFSSIYGGGIHNGQTNYGFLANTLRPLENELESSSRIQYLLYNHRPPPRGDPVPQGYGQASGVLLHDNTTGVFLIHNKPSYPSGSRDDHHSLEPGQLVLCMTFNVQDSLRDVTDYVDSLAPHDYRSRGISLPRRQRGTDLFTVQHAVSKGKLLQLDLFIKTNSIDLYSQAIAPYYLTDLQVFSWPQNLPEDAKKQCKHSRENARIIESIDEIRLPSGQLLSEKAFARADYGYTNWAVDAKKELLCIVDLGRSDAIISTRGGAVCIKNASAATKFASLIASTNCKPRKLKRRRRNFG